MYLADRDIKLLLHEIAFESDDPDHPFVTEDQVQPASVDLRLDSTFWLQKSKKPIDLRRSKLLELSPRRHWSKVRLHWGESITLMPGQMLLGRTFEKFSIPQSCAGKIEGRSSFSRMGIAIHCTGDFINPGYRRRMPLEIFNCGRSAIRLFPLIPICQLIFVRLSSQAEIPYGAALSSKYMDDDGGPSYWWRDKRIRQLHTLLGEHDVSERVQDELLRLMGTRDPELIERFEQMVRNLKKDELTNSEEILERFAESEDKKLLLHRIYRGVLVGLAPLLIAASISSLFSQPFGWNRYGWLHYVLWAVTLLTIPVSVVGLRMDIGEFFGSRELEEARQHAAMKRE